MAQTEESAKTSEINKEEKEAVKEQSDTAKILEQEAKDRAVKIPERLEEDDATRASFCLANGKKNFLLGEVVKAVFHLDEACELLAAIHGKTADQVADAYYIYGSALLEMSRIENGIGGTAMKGEECEKIEDQVMDAMTEEREEKKSDDKAGEETLNSQTSGDANGDAKPVPNGHTNGVNGHSETNGVNGHSETNGDAKPTDISNSEEKQNSTTNSYKETEEKATEHNNNEDKKASANETEENEKPTEMETEDKENEKPTEMETDGPKEKGKETEGAESEDLEGEDLEGEHLEGEDLERKDLERKDLERKDLERKDLERKDLEEGEVEYGSKEPKDYSPSIQRACKMLRLSITIYSRGTTEELKFKLSEAYMKLGEVCMERAQYLQALGNFKHCLKIQQANLSPEIAETHFIIGLCCGFCGQYDESLLNYKSAVTLMESKIAELQPVIDEFEKKKAERAEMSEVDEPTLEAKKEMKHLARLLPVIKAKIEDTLKKQGSQEKVKKHVQENIAMDTDGTTVTTAFGEQPECSTVTSDEPKSASDITHLVREKRKQDDDEEKESKKAKVEESDSKKEESKPEESKSEEKKQENDQKDTDEKVDTST